MRSILLVLFIILSMASTLAQAESGKDFLFSRMNGFSIIEQVQKEYESVAIWINNRENNGYDEITTEGAYVETKYNFEGNLKKPSIIQVLTTHENAVKSLGGTILYKNSEYRCLYAKFKKDEKAYYLSLNVYNDGATYVIGIVEPAKLESTVDIINAESIVDALHNQGKIALYFHFDTGKATIRPESHSVIESVVKALRAEPSMRVSVEGHTDNVGSGLSNQKLSEERAQAVVEALTHAGINRDRLAYCGFGQSRPTAPNDTEEGRAKNRRVELVRK